MSFDFAFEYLMKDEGGFSNYNEDRGGATNFGITRETLTAWRRTPVTIDDVRELKIDEARRIYLSNYWSPMKLDEFDKISACVLFDQAVNRGIHQVVHELQKILGVKQDGIVGKGTIYNAKVFKDQELAFRIIKVSQSFYANLVVRNPSNLIFLKGWIIRTHSLLDLLFSTD